MHRFKRENFYSIFYLQRIAILTKVNVRHNMAILTLCKIKSSYSQNRVSNAVNQWMKLRSTDPQVPSSNTAGTFIFTNTGKI